MNLVDESFGLAQSSREFITKETQVGQYDTAVLLGSGWAKAAELIGETTHRIPAQEVPGFHLPSVAGHSGTILSITTPSGKHVLAIGARTHLYEGKGIQKVVHPVRTAAACGAKVMILTNGSGAIMRGWSPGQAVLISDHINLTAMSPIVGPTFVDLSDLYSKRLRVLAKKISPDLEEGIYVQFRGPHYETPAEVQMAKSIGGHMVGMSTALEAIAAREAGMEVLGLSLITNLAAGISAKPLSHQEVIDSGSLAEPLTASLLSRIVQAI